MNTKQIATVLLEQNKEHGKTNAKRRAGQMFNDRLVALVKPKLPLMAKGYANEPWFRFALINAFGGAAMKFASTNGKLMQVTDAAIAAANDEFLGSFNIEESLNELLDGIPFLEEPTDEAAHEKTVNLGA